MSSSSGLINCSTQPISGAARKSSLDALADMNDPQAVYRINSLMFPGSTSANFDGIFSMIFTDVVNLFKGAYPGYRKCNTDYHDLIHTTDTLLALARIIHGASVMHVRLSQESVLHGL